MLEVNYGGNVRLKLRTKLITQSMYNKKNKKNILWVESEKQPTFKKRKKRQLANLPSRRSRCGCTTRVKPKRATLDNTSGYQTRWIIRSLVEVTDPTSSLETMVVYKHRHRLLLLAQSHPASSVPARVSFTVQPVWNVPTERSGRYTCGVCTAPRLAEGMLERFSLARGHGQWGASAALVGW